MSRLRVLWVLAFSFWIAACVVPTVPSAPLPLPVSPLPHPPMQATSPLPLPGQVGAPVIVVTTLAYLPSVNASIMPEFLPCAQNETAADMMRLLSESSWQNRAQVRCHPLLALAAQQKAEEMLRLRYFGHVSPDGTTANERVRATGYVLPQEYPLVGNSVESLILNYPTALLMFQAWFLSPSHASHLQALDPFFVLQECAGTGFVAGPADSGLYGAIITAPCPPGF